ncbi:hypothetical protein [Streptomyces sp. NRRL S-350]|uniref:hypothetical protein n=1 Tax=Streptomyces sp. NRRL S-350 TaxID=1463902 RepID=UPI0004BF80A9|nr:hypothetical protein [Streptomyces sp. NRRL S-350]
MNHFIVWVYASWAAIIAAGAAALYLPVHMNPKPKPVPVPAAPTPAPKPGDAGFWKIPKHAYTPVDWREPLNGEDNELVRPYCTEDEVILFATHLGLPDPAHWLGDVTTADRVLTGAGA